MTNDNFDLQARLGSENTSEEFSLEKGFFEGEEGAPSSDSVTSITAFLANVEKKYANRCAYSRFSETENEWKSMNYAELGERVNAGASGLYGAGIRAGNRVVILGEPSFDWVVNFYSVLRLGAIAVPLDVKLTVTEVSELVQHAEPKAILADSKWLDASKKLRVLKNGKGVKIFNLEEKWQSPSSDNSLTAIDTTEFERSEEIAVICYTSGTLGNPKGVMLKRSSFLFQATAIHKCFGSNHGDKPVHFSILPLNHAYGITIALFCFPNLGFETVLPHAMLPEAIGRCLRERQVTVMVVVPLYLRLVMNTVLATVKEKGALKEKIFHGMLKASSLTKRDTMKRKLFSSVHEKLGGSLKFFISGGAPLSMQVHDFFEKLGLPVYDGYGLTETSPIICVNYPDFAERGSVGRPMPDVKVRISESGELQTKGPHVMAGYFRNPEETKAVLSEDGWFNSGDIARINSSGAVTLLGRSKSLIVLSSGKKVHPEEIESVISQFPLVRLAGVVGVVDPTIGLGERVVAVIQPRDDLIAMYKGRTAVLSDLIQKELEILFEGLADYKKPSEVLVWEYGLPLTSTLKVKRGELKKLLEANSFNEQPSTFPGLKVRDPEISSSVKK